MMRWEVLRICFGKGKLNLSTPIQNLRVEVTYDQSALYSLHQVKGLSDVLGLGCPRCVG
jgi:hypothetical protein